ncbi:hypothetical protein QKY98_11395 [Pseudomonas sp. HR1]|jgi:hypothetical protein|uniref:hypothetical protein n=1 Tax=Pseudomonadaceae TaxID=135621 RepID=UPI0011A00E1F|nr:MULTISPECIES: hypothetical protein [Pseudomonas]MBA1256855.1 hypothetical protein [Pseudomonas psychrotolerans]MBH3330258.1 hypothetical protein [Pseudomonas oryzihabitans]MDK4199728.1 hypothetical protein [Pseudomonas sp. HR1]MDU4057896.1 hypothetical protein [Pseudomonas oryzihabitans]QEU01947.1 hypothetical protein FOB65_01010 [Pseudomonas oryzihabitans]
MKELDRKHGIELLERYSAEQDAINQLLRQIYECHGTADTEALRNMLGLCIVEIQERQETVLKAFRFLLESDARPQET